MKSQAYLKVRNFGAENGVLHSAAMWAGFIVSVVGCLNEPPAPPPRHHKHHTRAGQRSRATIRTLIYLDQNSCPIYTVFNTFSRRRLDCVRDSPQPVADEPRVSQRVQPQHMSHHRPPSPCAAIFTPEHPALWPKLSVTRRLSGRWGRNSTALSAHGNR